MDDNKELEIAGEVLARLTRSDEVESVHVGHLLILSAQGEVEFSLGDIHSPVYPRSAIKGIQAAAMVKAGLELKPSLLALVSASHSGSEMHQAGVLQILSGAGLSETDLQNTIDRPLGEEERRVWGQRPATSLAQNCSGKHAGMLATCVANGWTTADYLLPTHSLQSAIKSELELLAGERIVTTSVDGCGAPLFLLSLLSIARAIQQLTLSADLAHRRVIAACRAHPEMVAGENRSTTRYMRLVPDLFLKEGAEGVGVGSLRDGRTFAFKVSDGSSRPYAPLVSACLRYLSVIESEEATPIYGGSHVVGALTATF